MAEIPTVKVKDPATGDFIVINESDYDESVHELYAGETAPKPRAAEVDATDAARELAEDEGIDLATVEGSGKDGRITKGDVEAAIS